VILEAADRPESDGRFLIRILNRFQRARRRSIGLFPRPDGKSVAVSLSKKGSEDGDLYFFSVADGKQSPEVLSTCSSPRRAVVRPGPRTVPEFSTPVSLERESDRRLIYTFISRSIFIDLARASQRMPIDRQRFSEIAEVALQSISDSDWVVATVQNGDGGDFEHFVFGPRQKPGNS